MAEKLLFVNVKGNDKQWSFPFYGDPENIPVWRADGLEVFEIENTIPAWVAAHGLARPWCFVQDVFNLRNPWR